MIPAINRQQRRMMEKQQARVRATRRPNRPAHIPMLVKARYTLAPLEALIDDLLSRVARISIYPINRGDSASFQRFLLRTERSQSSDRKLCPLSFTPIFHERPASNANRDIGSVLFGFRDDETPRPAVLEIHVTSYMLARPSYPNHVELIWPTSPQA